jgi:DNA invertase Pin-like site-specific DNA recombinase
VWKLDRLGRSRQHLVQVVNDLRERDVDFRSLTEGFDTTTNGGKLAFHMFGAGRVRARPDHRAQVGCPGGRPRQGPRRRTASSPDRRAEALARKLHAEGQNVMTIARMLGTSRQTVYRTLEKASAAWRAMVSGI